MNIEPELRIGDTEREAAASALGEHFAAGRLTREEYDDRSTAVWAARTNADVAPLFADLPTPHVPSARKTRPAALSRGRHFRVPWLPVILMVLVLSAVLGGPWWLLLVAAYFFSRHHRSHSRGRDFAERGSWS